MPRQARNSIFVDYSGTIAAGGVAQTQVAADPQRASLLFENLAATNLYINFGAAAAAANGSYKIEPNGSIELADLSMFCPTSYVSVFGAVGGEAFTLKTAS